MTRTEKLLKAVIDEFGFVNNYVTNINRGGCGFFAQYLYMTLYNIGLQPDITIVGRGEENIKNVIQNNGSPNDITHWAHILIHVEGKYIDSDGVLINPTPDKVQYPDIVKGLTIELLREWNKNFRYWNPTFDRSQKETIKKGFLEIERIVKKKISLEKFGVVEL